MTQSTSDADWLTPDEPPSVSQSVRLPSGGVYVVDAEGETAVRFGSLSQAMLAGPPMSPEAQIRGRGGVLAEAAPDRAEWIATVLGAEMIEREIRGAA